MKKQIKILLHLVIVAVAVAIDQFSKYLILTRLTNGREIVIWDGVFKLVSSRNTGAVWGIMSSKTDMLVIVSLLILALVIWFYIKLPWDKPRLRPLRLICVFVTAGAIGNMIDRIRLHYVVDFLYFELIDFPVFNIADCYITVSMFLILFLFIFYYKEDDLSFLDRKKKTDA